MLKQFLKPDYRMPFAKLRVRCAGIVGALIMSVGLAPSPLLANTPIANRAAKSNPELMLIDVYKDLAANRLREAQAKADALVHAFPNFRLGHLIRGDLLLMHTRPVTSFGAASNGPAEELKNLRDEAIVRLKSLRERPDANLVPRSILQLRADQKKALIVDAKRSRLYVYENHDGQLKLMTDYYISQGKSGVDKFKEGDKKTPLGVYYITSHLPGARLPEFYGPGALPINYPNEWDKINGRGGSGIWLHGTPKDTFSRPPLSSDGCVVLTNQDLNELVRSVEIGKTPVVISEQVEFVDQARLNADRKIAAGLIDAWLRDAGSADPARLLAHYSSRFRSALGEGRDVWLIKNRQTLSGMSNPASALRDVSFFYYPVQQDMIVATFTQDAVIGKNKQPIRKRQYWAKEGTQWKIVSEIAL